MRISSGRLIRADKNGDEEDGPVLSYAPSPSPSFTPAIPPPSRAADRGFSLMEVMPAIDPLRRLKVSRPKTARARANSDALPAVTTCRDEGIKIYTR
jgi:hypothetical protein